MYRGGQFHPKSYQYEPFVCDFSINKDTRSQLARPRVFLALNAKKDWILHSLVNKLGPLVTKNIYICSNDLIANEYILDRYNNPNPKYNEGLPYIFPRNVTADNKPVLLTRSNKITAIYMHEKLNRTYIAGDFRYEILGGLTYADIISKIPDTSISQTRNTGSAYFQYDPSLVTSVYENIICVDTKSGKILTDFEPRYKMVNGNLVDNPNGLIIDNDVYVITGFDRLTKEFYDKDEGDLLIGGAFTDYLIKINKLGQKLAPNNFNLSITLNGAVHSIEVDYSTPPNANSQSIRNEKDINIYIGGEFTIAGTPNNEYMTRIKNDGTHNPMLMVGSIDFGLNGLVKCIKLLRYHRENTDDYILLIGGKFTRFNSLDVTKCAKIVRYNATGLHDLIDVFRPLYDGDTESIVNTIAEYSNSSWDYAILGGKFTNAGGFGATVQNICRILISDGSYDPNFNIGANDPFQLKQENLGTDGMITNIVFWDALLKDEVNNPDIYQQAQLPQNAYIYVAGSFDKFGTLDKYTKSYLLRLFVEPEYNHSNHFNAWKGSNH